VYSMKEVKDSYTDKKKEDAKKDPWGHNVFRPLSFYPAWLCIKLGITANQVTFAGIAIGIVGCGLLAFGSWGAIILGAILVNLSTLADFIDGDVARTTHTESEYGDRMDGFAYLVMVALLPISVGIGLYRHPDILFSLTPWVYLFLGIIASYTRTFRYAASYQSRLSAEPGEQRPGLLGFLTMWGMRLIIIRELLLLVCAICNALSLFLAFYAVMNTLEMLVILGKVMKK